MTRHTPHRLKSKFGFSHRNVAIIGLLFAGVGLYLALHLLGLRAAGNASLYLSPANQMVQVNNTLAVAVRVDTNEAVNAVQANLSYPSDKLEFISINTAGSAFEIPAEGSGGGGQVRIGRGTTGSVQGDHLVATVNFKAIASSGSAAVTFASGSAVVRSSDSTNILGSTIGGNYSFSAPPSGESGGGGTTAPPPVTGGRNNSASQSPPNPNRPSATPNQAGTSVTVGSEPTSPPDSVAAPNPNPSVTTADPASPTPNAKPPTEDKPVGLLAALGAVGSITILGGIGWLSVETGWTQRWWQRLMLFRWPTGHKTTSSTAHPLVTNDNIPPPTTPPPHHPGTVVMPNSADSLSNGDN